MRTLTHKVDAADDGRQIQRVIRSRMQLSYGQFKRLKARGALLLDGLPVHANHIVRQGQRIELTLDTGASTNAHPEPGPLDIVYLDQDLIIINKPAPLACQCSDKQQGGTLENRLAHQFEGETGFRFRPVNRLDKGTSGLMAAAMNAHAQMLLTRQLHTDAFVREYLAVVVGAPMPPTGVIEAPVGKADGATVRREVRKDGKPARTHYQTELYKDGLSLVRLRLDTGRTHQIRVHMSHMGCPVFGDFLYGQEDGRLPGRFALHACHLELNHPLGGGRLCFDAPLPDEMIRLIE